MRFAQVVCLGLIVQLAGFVVSAQQPTDEAAKEKQRRLDVLIEQILVEIPGLRLAENRSFVNAKTGYALWESDPKRGRALFHEAIAELMNALQEAAESKKNRNYQNEVLSGQAIRPQILNLIGARDAEFALEALYRTRPTVVSEALAFQPEKNTKISQYSNGQNHLAQSERQLEQSLLRLAADQNPERAAKLLKESLKKGLSYETHNLLNKLHEKDPAAAKQLASEIIDKMIGGKFLTGNQPDGQALNLATNFLNSFINQKQPNPHGVALDAAQMRKLAENLISFYLDPLRQQQYGYYLASLTQIAEKLVPSALERLNQAQKENKQRHHVDEHDEEVNKLLSTESTAEQLVAAARRFPVSARGRLYEAAASKYVQQGNVPDAMQLLENNFSDQALEHAVNNLNARRVNDLQAQGKFTEAETLIEELPEANRLQALINLAQAVFARNRDGDRSYAVALLTKARSSIAERPENVNEMSHLLQIITAYTNLDADEAVRLFAAIVPQFNELTDAAIVLYAFQGNTNIRQGETLIQHGNSFGVYLDQSLVHRFAEKDFDRTMVLIEGFSRREMRLMLRLYLAESGAFKNVQIVNLPSPTKTRNFIQ